MSAHHIRARWASLPSLLLWAGAASAAPLAFTDVYAVKVDNAAGIALNLLANDQGPAGLEVTAINGTSLTGSAQDIAVTGGTVRIAADGATRFVPDGTTLGTSSFSYAVTDTSGTTPDGQVKIYKLAQSLTPDVSTALQDATQSGSIWSNDPNNTTESASFTVSEYTIAGVAGPQSPGTPVAIPAVGSITLQTTGAWSFTPLSGYVGAVPQITYTVKRSVSTTGYTTAVDDNNQPVSADPHYWLNSVTGLDPSTDAPRTTPGLVSNHPWQSSFFSGGRVISSQNASRISDQRGNFDYGTAFVLPEGVDLSTATTVLRVGTDDFATLLFNANGVSVTPAWTSDTPTGYVTLDNSIPGALQTGFNQLSLQVNNTIFWHGLVVFSFITKYDDVRNSTLDITVNPGSPTPAPVPLGGAGIAALMTALLAAMAGWRLRQRRRV